MSSISYICIFIFTCISNCFRYCFCWFFKYIGWIRFFYRFLVEISNCRRITLNNFNKMIKLTRVHLKHLKIQLRWKKWDFIARTVFKIYFNWYLCLKKNLFQLICLINKLFIYIKHQHTQKYLLNKVFWIPCFNEDYKI